MDWDVRITLPDLLLDPVEVGVELSRRDERVAHFDHQKILFIGDHVQLHAADTGNPIPVYVRMLRDQFAPGSCSGRCRPFTQRTVPVEARITTLSVVMQSFRRLTPSSSEPSVTPVAAKMQSPLARSSR